MIFCLLRKRVGHQNLKLRVLDAMCLFCNLVTNHTNVTFCLPVVTEFKSILPHIYNIYIYTCILYTLNSPFSGPFAGGPTPATPAEGWAWIAGKGA